LDFRKVRALPSRQVALRRLMQANSAFGAL
jgi:hypothetical protein